MMAMQLMSERLLEEKISELQNKSSITSNEKMFLSLCKKELEIIKRLEFFGIDLTGTQKEVIDSIENKEIHFFDKGEFEKMYEKATKYDLICEIAIECGRKLNEEEK